MKKIFFEFFNRIVQMFTGIIIALNVNAYANNHIQLKTMQINIGFWVTVFAITYFGSHIVIWFPEYMSNRKKVPAKKAL